MKYICATCFKDMGKLLVHDTENYAHMAPKKRYMPLDGINREVREIEILLLKRFDISTRDHNHVHAKVEDAKDLLRIARHLLMEALAYKEDEL